MNQDMTTDAGPALDGTEIIRLRRQIRFTQVGVLALIATTGAGVMLGMRNADAGKGPVKFEELTVQRLNVAEADGTLRLVVSSRDRFPGDFYKGIESPRPDRKHVAGMLFLNDEGTECGGLIYGARMDENGAAGEAGLSLTFDRLRQDQTLQLLHQEGGGRAMTGVSISDRPDGMKYSIAELKRDVAEIEKLPPDQQQGRFSELQAAGKLGSSRAYLGTTADRGSALVLNDASGRPRLMLLVTAEGEPKLQVFDDNGKVKGEFAITPAAPSAPVEAK